MAIEINGKVYRNIQEQVAENQDNITELKQDVSAIQALIDSGEIGITIQIVETLPTEDINPHCIYLILNSDPETENVYDEYMYIEDNWELIGSTATDLSDYYTKTQTDSLLTNYYTKTQTDTAISNAISGTILKYIGTTTTALTDGSTTNPIIISGESITAVAGNVASYGDDEFIFDGTSWKQFGSVGFANPMTTQGDIIVGGTNGIANRLPKGTTGQVLKATASGVEWASDNEGMTNPMTTQGDLIVGGTNGIANRLPKGTTGQVLKATASGVEWANESGGGGGGASRGFKVTFELNPGVSGSKTIPDYFDIDGVYHRGLTNVSEGITRTIENVAYLILRTNEYYCSHVELFRKYFLIGDGSSTTGNYPVTIESQFSTGNVIGAYTLIPLCDVTIGIGSNPF